jgi:hypothetical protein
VTPAYGHATQPLPAAPDQAGELLSVPGTTSRVRTSQIAHLVGRAGGDTAGGL